jgi:AcrR family transcriptional regulator
MANVKRNYDSSRRQEQARRTRRSILVAAGRLFTSGGYGATTLQQVADEAGVAVQTVYAAFGNKAALLEELLDTSIAGDDTPVAVNDRDWMHDVFHHPDPTARVDAYAAAVTGIHERAGDIFSVVRAAATTDPTLASLADTTEQRRRNGATNVIDGLDTIGALRGDLTVAEAVDILWTLNSPEIHQRLVRDSGWTPERFQDWLAAAIRTALLAPTPPSRPH